jgi:hypothetical protein
MGRLFCVLQDSLVKILLWLRKILATSLIDSGRIFIARRRTA